MRTSANNLSIEIAIKLGENVGKCLRCEKKGLFLKRMYCHACGKPGCPHCMILLFRFDSSFLSEKVVVCSEDCWWNFKEQIEAIIHKNMSDAWSATEKREGYYGDEGRRVNEALIRDYLSYAQENPFYPYRERVERGLEKVQERPKLYEKMRITWYCNSKKCEESENLLKVWFPENQERRAKRGLSRQYLWIPYECETVVIAYDPTTEIERPLDSSLDLFRKLAFSRLRKQEELGGPSFKEAMNAVNKNAQETRARERDEMERERMEEYMARRSWDQARAQDKGTCDWCNQEIGGTYYTCGHCKEIFCCQRCAYEHDEHVHEE